ncbi:MAG: hypothetical protein U0228_08055 [Myxococcaceae bacterium]
MTALLVVVSLALGADPSRADILTMMANPPDPYCATGNPWANFVALQHSAATNQLLMAMTADATLTAQQRQLALVGLGEQHTPAVWDFMRALVPKTEPGTPKHRVVVLSVISASPADQEAIVTEELGSGDTTLDTGILVSLMNARELKPTPPTVTKVRSFQASASKGDKEYATQFLARVDPGSTLSAALRSKDARTIDAVANELNDSVSTDDLIEGLAFAGDYGRDSLENHLALRLRAVTRKNGSSPLTEEWASATPRAGLLRAPLSAYVLGTQAESNKKYELARQIYVAGRAANQKLLDAPHRYGVPRELVATELAFRAQLANLALKTKQGAAGLVFAKNLLAEVRENGDAWDVFDNFCAGERPDVLTLEAKLAKLK